MFGRAIWYKLPECIFGNFETVRVKRGQFQNFQKSWGWFIPKIARTKNVITVNHTKPSLYVKKKWNRDNTNKDHALFFIKLCTWSNLEFFGCLNYKSNCVRFSDSIRFTNIRQDFRLPAKKVVKWKFYLQCF